ncbi:MAG: GntR family transcriptional regulator [Bacteriovoracaceae bacterium]|nr:GntR family transcriptional regulator [Bacteroidota bacterium]
MAKIDNNSLIVDFTDLAPLRDRIASSIRNAIIDGRMLPGTRLTEQELVSMLGVSRTPLREALLLLDAEGFVNVLPRKGAVVSAITKEDVEEIYGAKSILETAAAKLACEKISYETIESLSELTNEMEAAMNDERKDYRTMLNLNSEFHQLLSDAGGNKRISQFIRNLRSQTLRYNYIYLSLQSRIETSIADHRHMIEALKQRDKERIAQLIQDHNASACRSLCEFIQQHSLTNPNVGTHLE